MTGRRLASTKAGRRSTEPSPSRPRKRQARPTTPSKEAAQKPVRGQAQTRRKITSARGGGRRDSAVAAQLEAIARRLEQINDLRAELADMRAVVDALAENVAALLASRAAQDGDVEQPVVADEVVIIETNDGSPDQEAGRPGGSFED